MAKDAVRDADRQRRRFDQTGLELAVQLVIHVYGASPGTRKFMHVAFTHARRRRTPAGSLLLLTAGPHPRGPLPRAVALGRIQNRTSPSALCPLPCYRVSFLYLILCGWSAAAPSRRFRSAS